MAANEVLGASVFESIREAREITCQWITACNKDRTDTRLGGIPPAMFRPQVERARNSTFELSP